jgi:polar amino acid transport system substrate-binding protein/cystine transport system substrate-binding protein/membrane-bound lytic murein transglycosylase F
MSAAMARRSLLRDALGALPILALLAAVYLLPPDTSLSEVRHAGTLHVCLPPAAPPFVTGNAERPGIDIEILQTLAHDLKLTLARAEEPAMSRDFNPRAWHITRAACEVLAGGIVASPMTRSFLEMSQPYADTGWAVIAMPPLLPADARELKWSDLHGRKLGVFAPPSGLDRIAPATRLRAEDVQMSIASNADALAAGLREGRFEAAVTERLLADSIAAREHWTVQWLPADLPRFSIAFGLWKGDLTLKRALGGALDQHLGDGSVAAIRGRYLGSGA